MHQLMELIPFPGPSWHQVITEHPSLSHLSWCIIFTIACGFVQILCHILTKTLAPILMGYSTTVPLPKATKNHQQHYQRLIELTQRLKGNEIETYSMRMISEMCCDGELADEEVRNFLDFASQHHWHK